MDTCLEVTFKARDGIRAKHGKLPLRLLSVNQGPSLTIIEIAPEEQARILAAIRRRRYGYELAWHIVLLCAAHRNPTEIAAVLFCSRSTVYRAVQA